MKIIWIAALAPLLSCASELEFRTSDKAVFVVREPTFTATSGIPFFRATVDDRTGDDWDDKRDSPSILPCRHCEEHQFYSLIWESHRWRQ
jgi:hypothetical protein